MLRLDTPQGGLDIGFLASDLDRTLTDEVFVPVPAALAELRRLREAGVTTILATGRREDDLHPSLFGVFDAWILEGGALVGTPDSLTLTGAGEGWRDRFQAWLETESIPHEPGRASFAVRIEHLPALQAGPMAREAVLSPNRTHVDITPLGVDKGVALRRTLDEVVTGAGACIAFGDSHNDLPLLATADYGVAVGNAEPVVQAAADEVAQGWGGTATAAFLARRLR